MDPHTREFVKQFNASIKSVLGLKKAMSHRRISIIMGKFAATPMIAKSFEKTMMRYHERFVKPDPNVDKERINNQLNEKHEAVTKWLKVDKKWALTKEDIDRTILQRIYGDQKWNIMEQLKHGTDIITVAKW